MTDKKKLFYFFQKQFFDVVPISATGFLPPESNATTTATAATPRISGGGASTSSPLNTGWCGRRYKWTAGWCNYFSWVISHSLLRMIQKYYILLFGKTFVEWICFESSTFTQKERWKFGLRWRTCLHEIAGCYWACPKCNASNIVRASRWHFIQ